MRARRTAGLMVLLALSVMISACKMQKLDLPLETDFTGVTVKVWDLSQPTVAGAPDYRSLARRVAAEFAEQHEVTVELRFATRKEVSDLLAGEFISDAPDLVCTGEQTFIPTAAREVPITVARDDYLEAAVSYWSSEGRLLAIPAYIQWTGVAARPTGDRSSYFVDSAAFLTAALDPQGSPWDPESVAAFLTWVKQQWGQPDADPLRAWDEGSSKSLYPVTPFMWERLRTSSASGEVTIEPVSGPFPANGYFYSVPAYMVLAEGKAERACATRLGAALAGNLGRWAARAAGCIPALRADVSVFNLESRFGFDDRADMLSSLKARQKAPLRDEYLEQESLKASLGGLAADFLGGRMTEAELRRSIQEAMQRHTKP